MGEVPEQSGVLDATSFENSLAELPEVSGELEMLAPMPSASGVTAATPMTPTAQPGSRPPRWSGRVLKHYRLIRMMGEGAMARVVLAEDLKAHQMVALKVMNRRVATKQGQEQVEQFLREARAAARIDHPNVVRIYEISNDKGWWFMATELVDGGNVGDLVRANGPFPPARACSVAADACLALAAAHERGVIHRDVKPSNLLITRSGRCKVGDFGLVQWSDPDDPFQMTAREMVVADYLSPEAVRFEPLTAAADMYSLGAVLFFMLTGRPPFVSTDRDEVLRHHLQTAAMDVRELNSAVPVAVAQIIGRCLSKNPLERPRPNEMAALLRNEAGPLEASGPLGGKSQVGLPTVATNLPHAALGPMGSGQHAHLPPRKTNSAAPWLIVGFAMAVSVVIVAFFLAEAFQPTPTPATTPLFPGAGPATWRSPAELTTSVIASRDGRFYYAPDDPRLRYIPQESLVTFENPTAAAEAGKLPASAPEALP